MRRLNRFLLVHSSAILASLLGVLELAQARLPDDGPAGTLVIVDEIARQVRWYHQEKDPRKRAMWLGQLQSSRDPRIAVLLGEATSDPDEEIACFARVTLQKLYGDWPPCLDSAAEQQRQEERVIMWWKTNAVRLRREANLLPK
jgi:hypothetical protein